jgi:DNA repair protein RadC
MDTIKKISLKLDKSKYERKQLTSSQMVAEYIRGFYGTDIELFESCFLLLLDQSNTTIGYAKISQGGICGTIVDIKIVCKYVIDSLAQNVILCHNHPSGNLTPSRGDKDLTEKLSKALQLMDSRLLDHIIISKNGHYSIQENEGIN